MESRFKANILQEYFNVMLYRDLMDRYEIRDASILKYLIKRLIGSFTKEFSVNKLYNDLKSRGIRIGKDSIYRVTDKIFSIYMVTYIEKFDPAVVKREMSNKKFTSMITELPLPYDILFQKTGANYLKILFLPGFAILQKLFSF
jgi:predicted AAA+ superfamily ATPase